MRESEVSFATDIRLMGTLCLPEDTSPANPAPAIVLLGGTGGDTRDGEMNPALFAAGAAPPERGTLRRIAHELGNRGIATLRFDKRGVCASGGTQDSSNYDTDLRDNVAGYRFLQEHRSIDAARVGVAGHSAGAFNACLVCRDVPEVACAGLLGALYGPIDELIRHNWPRIANFWDEFSDDQRAWLLANRPREVVMAFRTEEFLAAMDAGVEVVTLESHGISMEFNTTRGRQDHLRPVADEFRHVQCPALILHGGADLNVKVEDCLGTYRGLRAAGNERVDLGYRARARTQLPADPGGPDGTRLGTNHHGLMGAARFPGGPPCTEQLGRSHAHRRAIVLGFILRRAAQSLPVLLGVSIIAWALVSIAPGDASQIYAHQFAESVRPTDEEIERARIELGLDGNPLQQYTAWLQRAASGNFGRSFSSGSPVADELRARAWPTVQLALAATTITVLLEVTAGVVAALSRDRWPDNLARLLALIGGALPSFWLSLILIWVFAVKVNWLPSFGRGGIDHLVLPSVALGLGGAGAFTRLVRASMLDVLSQDYITVARAKGLPGRTVVIRHALRNALFPVVTQVGLTLGALRMEELEINRTELARRMGVSRARVTQVLSGSDNLTLKTLVAVVHALGSRLSVEVNEREGPAATEMPSYIAR